MMIKYQRILIQGPNRRQRRRHHPRWVRRDPLRGGDLLDRPQLCHLLADQPRRVSLVGSTCWPRIYSSGSSLLEPTDTINLPCFPKLINDLSFRKTIGTAKYHAPCSWRQSREKKILTFERRQRRHLVASFFRIKMLEGHSCSAMSLDSLEWTSADKDDT